MIDPSRIFGWHILHGFTVTFCRLIAHMFVFQRRQNIQFIPYFSSVMKTLIFQVQSAPLVMIILLRLRMAPLATLVIARVRQSAHAVRKEDGTLGEKQHIVRSVLRQLFLCNFLMENIMQALILIMEFCKFSLYDVSYRA